MVVAVGQKSALEMADASRRGQDEATPYALWQRANEEARTESERRDLYRHAMVHAGHLVTKAGTTFRRCPICREPLRAS